jgi:amino acid transporter
MTAAPDAPPKSRLEELGYHQGLRRRLHVWHVVGLSLADVSPTMAVVFLTAGVFVIGGTFAAGANLLLAVCVVLICLCLAELGSMYPIAGGMYSLVRNVLPAPIAWITMFNYLLQGIVIPASIAIGIAQFLNDLLGTSISEKPFALVLLLLALCIALVRVEIGAWVTIVMVVVELTVLGIITVSALLHPHQGLTDIVFHPHVLSGTTLTTVSFGVMLATIAPAFNVINGYDATLGFTEELIGGENAIAKAVVTAGILASLFIVVPLIAAMVAAPDLVAFFKSSSPILYSVQQAFGSGARKLVDFGAAIALFNANLALIMYFGRGFYTTGRDAVWPPFVSRKLAELNRFSVPALGILCCVVPACVLIFVSALNFLIIFAGTIIAAVYFTIGLAALWSRISQADVARPYRMPLWPFPPLFVIAFTGVALAKQEGKYLFAELVLIAVALVLWALSRLWAPAARRELVAEGVTEARV